MKDKRLFVNCFLSCSLEKTTTFLSWPTVEGATSPRSLCPSILTLRPRMQAALRCVWPAPPPRYTRTRAKRTRYSLRNCCRNFNLLFLSFIWRDSQTCWIREPQTPRVSILLNSQSPFWICPSSGFEGAPAQDLRVGWIDSHLGRARKTAVPADTVRESMDK